MTARRRSPAAAKCVVVLGAMLLGACGERVEAPARAGHDARDPDLAAFLDERYRRASAEPRSALMRGRLAMAYDANGFDAAALASYAQAARLDPDDFRWPYLRSLLLGGSGDYDAALDALDKALALDAAHAPAWLWRGTWLLDLGRSPEAESAFREALGHARDDSADAAARTGIARALLQRGLARPALDLLEPLASASGHPFILRQADAARRALGRDVGARAAEAASLEWKDPLRAALADYVRGFDGRLRLAENLLQGGEAREALRLLEALRERRPSDRTLLNNLAVAYGLTGRPAAAFDTLEAALAEHGDYYLFHVNIAAAHEEREEFDQALAHVERALALQPGFAPAHARKLALLRRLRRYDDALAAVDAAAAAGAGDRDMLYDAGVIEGARGRWPQAVARFRQAVAFDPAFARAHLALGRSLIESRRFGDARLALADAERLGAEGVESARRRLRALETPAAAAGA